MNFLKSTLKAMCALAIKVCTHSLKAIGTVVGIRKIQFELIYGAFQLRGFS